MANQSPRRVAPDLTGKLAAFHPSSVLQMLNLSEATGELTLRSGKNTAKVYFERGQFTYAGIKSRASRLGEYLIEQGVLTEDQLAPILRKKGRPKRLGERLIDAGLVDREALVGAIETQIREVIYEVLRWQEGRFSFVTGRMPEGEDVLVDVPLDHVMLEGLARWDEGSAETSAPSPNP